MVSKGKVFFKGQPHPLPQSSPGCRGWSEGSQGARPHPGFADRPMRGGCPVAQAPCPAPLSAGLPPSLRGLREGAWGGPALPGSARLCRPARPPGSLPPPACFPRSRSPGHGGCTRPVSQHKRRGCGVLAGAGGVAWGPSSAAARAGLARAAPSQRGCGPAVGRISGARSPRERAAPQSPPRRWPRARVASFLLHPGGRGEAPARPVPGASWAPGTHAARDWPARRCCRGPPPVCGQRVVGAVTALDRPLLRKPHSEASTVPQ